MLLPKADKHVWPELCVLKTACLSVVLLSDASCVYTYLLAQKLLTFFMLEALSEAKKTLVGFIMEAFCASGTYTVHLTRYKGSAACSGLFEFDTCV